MNHEIMLRVLSTIGLICSWETNTTCWVILQGHFESGILIKQKYHKLQYFIKTKEIITLHLQTFVNMLWLEYNFIIIYNIW
jgi:hypothetical protein